MRNPLALVIVSVILAGCHPSGGGDGEAPTRERDVVVADELASNPDSVPGEASLVVPEGSLGIGGAIIAPEFEFTQRYDRVRLTTNTKREQRQILLEAEVGSGSEAMGQMRDAMIQAGFDPHEPKEEYGGVRARFTKKGERDVFVLVRERGDGPTIRNEAAHASVYVTQMR